VFVGARVGDGRVFRALGTVRGDAESCGRHAMGWHRRGLRIPVYRHPGVQAGRGIPDRQGRAKGGSSAQMSTSS
jgi:hypothetical protein